MEKLRQIWKEIIDKQIDPPAEVKNISFEDLWINVEHESN